MKTRTGWREADPDKCRGIPSEVATTAAKEKLSSEVIESMAEVKQRVQDLSIVESGAVCCGDCTDDGTTIAGRTRMRQKKIMDVGCDETKVNFGRAETVEHTY